MSTKPLPEKLWIRANYRILILDQPAGYMDALGKLPDGVKVSGSAYGEYDLIQVFMASKADRNESCHL